MPPVPDLWGEYRRAEQEVVAARDALGKLLNEMYELVTKYAGRPKDIPKEDDDMVTAAYHEQVKEIKKEIFRKALPKLREAEKKRNAVLRKIERKYGI